MNAMLDSLFAWLLDFSALATALLVVALLMRFLLREPASRVTLAWGTWLAIVAGGVFVTLPSWPRIEAASWFATPVDNTQVVLEEATAMEYVYLSEGPLEPVALPTANKAPVADAPALSAAAIGTRVWLVIAALACGWLAMGLVRAWRLIACAQPAPPWTREELRQIIGPARRNLPGLLTSRQIASALALGTLRPRIVLPLASAAKANAPAVRAALAHEWAHIAAGDLWLLALERSLVPLLALHPLFWWLRRLTRLDQELAADAAAAGDKPAEYAEALLDWAKGEPHRHSGVAALAMWERPSNLSRRIQMILDPKRQPTARRGRLSAYAVLALLFTLALGLSLVSWRPMSAQDKPAAESADSPASGELRVYPLIGPARLTRTLPAPPAEGPAIMIELQLLSLDPQGLADAKIDLPVLLKRPQEIAAKDKSILAAELDPKETDQLVEIVRTAKGTITLSQPKLVTLDGQEATIVVGGQLPLISVEETVNGKTQERRVEYKDFGTKLRVKPHILVEDPKMVVLEVFGEQSTLNRDPKEGADPTAVPRLNTQRVELTGTVELGKTLVVLPTAVAVPADGAAETKGPAEKRLLILLRPSVVEHKYVEVYPDPNAATRATASRGRYLPPQTVAADGDEAKLAEQLRSIRQAVEELAREREASRRENAALKAELERLKSQLPGATPQAVPPAPAGVLLPYVVPSGKSATRVTQVYQFASAGEAAEAGKALSADGKLEKHGAAIMVANTNVTITGPTAAVKELSPILAAKGKLLTETEHASHNAAWAWAQATTPHTSEAATTAHPAGRVSRVYVFAGNKEAGDAVRTLAAGWKVEGLEIGLDLRGNSLVVTGSEAALAKAEPALVAIGAGKLAMQTRTGATEAVIAADPKVPQATLAKAIEWLRTHQADGQWAAENTASAPSDRDRRTQRKLLELDLQAAELEFQAAQEDFAAAQKLHEQKAISAEEFRNKRRLVERTKIQLAKLKVMLEAEEEQPPAANNLQRQ